MREGLKLWMSLNLDGGGEGEPQTPSTRRTPEEAMETEGGSKTTAQWHGRMVKEEGEEEFRRKRERGREERKE